MRFHAFLATAASVALVLHAQTGAPATEEAANPALRASGPTKLVFGAFYGVPESGAKPAQAPAPDATAIAPAGEPVAAPAPALPQPVLPPPGLLTAYRVAPDELASFVRPPGAEGESLLLLTVDWTAAESRSWLARGDDAALEKFLRATRAAVRAAGARARVVLPPPPAGEAGVVFMKRFSSAVRGEDHEAKFGLLLAGPDPVAALTPWYDADLAPYIDNWSVAAGELTKEGAAALQQAMLAKDATAELTILDLPVKAMEAAGPLALGIENGFRLFVWQPLPAGAKFVPVLRDALPAGAIGVSLDGRGGAFFQGGPNDGKPVENFILAKLYDDKSDTEFLFAAAPGADPKQILKLVLPTADASQGILYAPLHDARFPLEISARDERRDLAAVLAYARGEPFLVSYKRFALRRQKTAAGEEPGGRTTVAVKAKYQIPVDELIKRYQAWQAGQDFRLERWTAKATVHYLFGLAASAGSVNVSFENNFFFDRKAGAAWEQTGMKVEGIEWTGRDIPELPIPQPEKVNTVPLDIAFGRQYEYSLAGEETVNGRKAWKVRFKPLDPAQALYDGHLWIDQQSYARLRVSAVQTGVKPPLLSTDETTDYAPIPAPDGGEIWVMRSIRGQQTFSAAGQTLKAQRRVEFAEVALNPPDYQTKLAAASAGDNHMLVDTDKGLQYFEKGADGTRAPRKARTRRWLVGGALYHDPSINFAGSTVAGGVAVDYLDSDFMGKDWQFNFLTALVFTNATFANPHLLGSRTTFTASASLSPLTFTDRFYRRGVEQKLEQVGNREQDLYLSLSHPAGNFVNLRGGIALAPVSYASISPKDRAGHGQLEGTGPDFLVPESHLQSSVYGEIDFTRRGWGAALEGESFSRSKWSPWGTPAEQAAFDPGAKSFAKWNLAFSKEFPLAHYRRFTLAATWLDGRSLDRFSQYHFTMFGQKKLPGFAGSGVRFDQGWLAQAGYGVTAGDFMRIGADVGWARVRTRDRAVNGVLVPGEDWTSHAGVALAANFLSVKKYIKFLPQNTLIRFEVGYAAKSDDAQVKGNTTFTLALLKLLR